MWSERLKIVVLSFVGLMCIAVSAETSSKRDTKDDLPGRKVKRLTDKSSALYASNNGVAESRTQ